MNAIKAITLTFVAYANSGIGSFLVKSYELEREPCNRAMCSSSAHHGNQRAL